MFGKKIEGDKVLCTKCRSKTYYEAKPGTVEYGEIVVHNPKCPYLEDLIKPGEEV